MKVEIIDDKRTRMLDDEFHKGDRDFLKVGDYTIKGKPYHLYRATFSKGKYNENSSYELFKQRFRKKGSKDTHSDEEYTHYEQYPGDNDFGSWAWSFVKIEQAERWIAKQESE